MGMRIDRYKDRHDVVMFFHHKPDEADIAAITSVKKILGLRSKKQEYKIVYCAIPKDDCEIAILSRSMLKIMAELGSHIEVPDRDVTENRVRPTLIENTDAFPDLRPLIRIQSNIAKPAVGNQTSFGFDVHANLFKNRVRIGLGVRDAINNAEDTIFLTIGIADLPGLAYWMSR